MILYYQQRDTRRDSSPEEENHHHHKVIHVSSIGMSGLIMVSLLLEIKKASQTPSSSP